MKIVLISCTKKKKDCRCAAWELYSASELFKKELVYARELTTDNNIYVLSAKHGLIQLTDELDPYNQTLNGAKKSVVGETRGRFSCLLACKMEQNMI